MLLGRRGSHFVKAAPLWSMSVRLAKQSLIASNDRQSLSNAESSDCRLTPVFRKIDFICVLIVLGDIEWVDEISGTFMPLAMS